MPLNCRLLTRLILALTIGLLEHYFMTSRLRTHYLSRVIWVYGWFALGAVTNSYAAELALNDMLNMSLAELLDVKVDVGTRSAVEIQKTPGIVRVFVQKDFERYGFRTLQDVLQQMPGYQINAARVGHSNLFIRGVQGRSTSKILLLIDGVPMRDLFWGNFNVDEMINLAQVERVELLNGPGSVLYGANAFAGIIKITTKSEGRSIEAGYGVLDSYKDGETEQHHFQQVVVEGSTDHVYGFAEYYDSEGFNPERNRSGELDTQAQRKHKKAAFVKYNNNGLTALASVNDYEYPYTLSDTGNEREFHREPSYASVQYQHEDKQGGSYHVQGFVNRSNLSRVDDSYTDEGDLKRHRIGYRNGWLLGLDADSSRRWGDHQVTFGLSWLRDEGGRHENVSYNYKNGALSSISSSNLLLEDPSRDDIGLFVQDLWQFNRYLSATAGMRYSYLSDFDNQLTYRLGLTGQYEQWYSKLLFGTAFRVPTYRESLKLYDNPLIGRNLLKPETLTTLEAQLGYRFSKADINVTLYRNSYNDFITDLPTKSVNGQYLTPDAPEDGDEYSYNLDEINTFGVELGGTWYPQSNFSLRFALSALLTAEETAGLQPENTELLVDWYAGTRDLGFLSEYTASLAAGWQISPRYRLGASVYYVGARSLTSDYQSRIDPELRNASNADAYTVFNLNATASLYQNWALSFYINNLFDTRSYGQHMQDPTEYDIENAGRVLGVYLKASY